MRKAEVGSSSSNNIDVVSAIRRKLRDAKVKVASVVHLCELKDRNGDGFIHIDDLEDIFNDVVGSEHRITRRELLKFATFITDENQSHGRITYEKIADVLEPAREREARVDEQWKEDDADEGDTAWATQPGTAISILKYQFAIFLSVFLRTLSSTKYHVICILETTKIQSDEEYE